MGKPREQQGQQRPQRDSEQQSVANDAGEGGVDRLSSLPQPIWTHILSLLPTADAVATGVLSRRWRRRWLHLSHLDLDPDAFYGDDLPEACVGTCEMTRFASFVDLVLPACVTRRSLRRLALRFGCSCRNWTNGGTERWIRLAMAARQLVALELDFSRFPWVYDLGGSGAYDLGPIPVPQTLEEMKLVTCSFDASGFDTFSALKSLTLSFVTLHGGDPISQCPVLESLTISDCKLTGGLDIQHPHLRRLELEQGYFSIMGASVELDSPELETLSLVELLCCEALVVRNALQLRSLVVENCYTWKEEGLGVSLEIEAPKLDSFTFVGAVGKECSVSGPAQLDEADVEVHPWRQGKEEHDTSWVRQLLKGVSGARSLTLSGSGIQSLSTETDTPETLPTPFRSLKVLTLNVGLVPEELPAIACLLRSSPILQTLSISFGDESYSASIDLVNLDYELQNLHQLYGDYWESQESPMNCLVHHLNRIEISNYKGKQIEEDLARFLVSHAMVLKEMPISTPTTSFSGFEFL